MSYIYLASPYSHANPDVMEARFLAAEAVLAHLLRTSEWTYSPIVHCHALAKRHDLPTDHEFWGSYNLAMLHRAHNITVLTLPGWEESRGVQQELQWARAIGLSIGFYSWHPNWDVTSTLSGAVKRLIQSAMGEEGAKAL